MLVNNAGVGMQGTVDERPETAEEEWRRLFEVNVLGVDAGDTRRFACAALLAHASIVNVCSFVAHTGAPRRAAYGASKGAVFALTKALAADHLADGIRANSVSPGTVDTPWIDRLLDATGIRAPNARR